MLKKTITYEDFNGKMLTEDFYFHMTKLDLVELELQFEGGLDAKIKELTRTTDGPAAYQIFKDIVLNAYGEKSPDGRRFVKTPEVRANLEFSPALGELIISFLEDPQKAAEFTSSLLPKSLVDEAKREAAKQRVSSDNVIEGSLETLSREELVRRLQATNEGE